MVTLEAFQQCTIPLSEWTHLAHLTVAYLLVRAYGPEDAIIHMRRGVQAYNARNGIEQTATGGYHETVTIAWMRIVRSTIAVYGPGADAEEFLSTHPHLLNKTLLRVFYSRDRIMSDAARRGWVEPDLATLP